MSCCDITLPCLARTRASWPQAWHVQQTLGANPLYHVLMSCSHRVLSVTVSGKDITITPKGTTIKSKVVTADVKACKVS